mgnify:CR=1 FL=1
MKTFVTKRKITALLLAIFMTLSLLPIAVSAASATGYATATVGSADIVVSLSGSSRFSESEEVENTANWTLVASGSQTIISVTWVSETSARVTLSSQAEKGQTFTLNALDAVFAEGTEPFASPISVTVATPAEGTAEGTAGDSNILVTLSVGRFGANSSVKTKDNWMLGGASAGSNSIASVTYDMNVSNTTATLTLTNPIAAGDVYTVTASQAVFINAFFAPFASPLEVAIINNDEGDETYACQIGEIPYLTLDEALDKVATGQTITLLQNITHTSPVEIVGKSITFALGSFDLTIDTSATNDSTALLATDGGVVNYTGAGKFSVIGNTTAAHATGTGSALTVGYAETTADHAYCVKAENNGTVTVKGTAQTKGHSCFGLWAESGGDIIMEGDVTCLDGNSTALYCTGNSSSIEMTGDIKATATNKNNDASHGVDARDGASAEVTGNISASGVCVRAYGAGAATTVTGDIFAEGINAIGALGSNGGTATIDGNISATGGMGGKAIGGTVVINGNVNSTYSGAHATNYNDTNGIVTINGTLTATAPTYAFYIKVGSDEKTAAQDNKDSDQAGYLQYTDGANKVYVKIASANVCSIGTREYATLAEALEEAVTGDTITLLQSITHTSPVEIAGKSITFALGSFDLTIDTSTEDGSTALLVTDGGKVNYTGAGKFSAIGNSTAVRADGASSALTVGYAETTGDVAYTVQATSGGTATVNGNVVAKQAGTSALWTASGGSITITGSVTCVGENSTGARSAGTGSNITVHSGITATAAGDGSTGVNANNGGTATITGDISASERGVTTFGSGSAVTVTGNVSITGTATGSADREGISAGGGTTVTVNGNVSAAGENCTGIYANGSTVTVTGDVTSENTGVVATGLNGTVTIDGELTADTTYIKVGTIPKTAADDNKDSDLAGYLQYTDGTHNVYIKNVPATSYTLTVVSGTGDGSYAAGMPVSITANPPTQGKMFDKWISSGGGSFGNATSASTFFTMPDKAVTVTATYKDLPSESYAVNVQNDGNGTASASTISATAGTEVTLTGTPGSGYRFKEWQVVSGNVTVINNKFTMPAATVTVKAIFELIPAETPEYKITKGSNQSWTKGTASGVEITCDGNLSKFSGIKVDGVLINAANYTASGSTVVTLKSAYLETLSVGHHTVEIVYNDGRIQTRLAVLAKEGATPTDPEESGKVPQMGDNGNLALLFGLLFISGGAILGISLHDKKRRSIRGKSR